MVAGTKDFIEKAKFNRKRLGGGMRQAGIIAAAGIIALEVMTKRLKDDHDNARYMAEKLAKLPHVKCSPDDTPINMVFFNITKPGFCPDNFVRHMNKNNILTNGEIGGPGVYRWLTHNDVSRDDIDVAVKALEELL